MLYPYNCKIEHYNNQNVTHCLCEHFLHIQFL